MPHASPESPLDPAAEIAETRALRVDETGHGQRLDRWLTAQIPDQSRAALQRWISDGLVTVDGLVPNKAGIKLEAGQTVTVAIPAPQESRLEAEAIPLSIVYEDEAMLVVDKPAGLVVHPAPGHPDGTLVNAVLHHVPDLAGVGGERRPGIVHRLDKETSGLIVVAKNDQAHRALQRQFARRTVRKVYLTLLEGSISPAKGRIDAPIGRHPVQRQRMAVLPPDFQGQSQGRPAITEYELLGLYSARLVSGQMANFSYVQAAILTGRTHQIRVHFAWMKYPVVGDTLYGYRRQRLDLPRHFLHAHRLTLRLPTSGEEREFVSPLPADLQTVLDGMGG